MVVIVSKLFRSYNYYDKFILNTIVLKNNTSVKRLMSHHGPRLFPMAPSRWQWIKFKDLFLFYMCIGFFVYGSVVIYMNIYIGPGQLTPIPKKYVPKHWEYYQNPITRILAQYVFPNPQQEYEKFMNVIYEERERQELRKLEKRVRALMAERRDYKAWYYRPIFAKYHRASHEAATYLESLRGD